MGISCPPTNLSHHLWAEPECRPAGAELLALGAGSQHDPGGRAQLRLVTFAHACVIVCKLEITFAPTAAGKVLKPGSRGMALREGWVSAREVQHHARPLH